MLHPKEYRASEPSSEAAWSVAQRTAILAEASHILADPAFKNSRRCVTLFRRLIEHALDGDLDGVKERTLAIEVFGRDANYDTNTDPVVRMTANEIRKRLAQYYQSSTHIHDLTIRMVSGTYLPRFEFGAQERPLAADEVAAPEPAPGLVQCPGYGKLGEEAASAAEQVHPWWKWTLWAVAGLLAIAGVLVVANSNFFRSTQDLLWAPVLESGEPVIVCVGDFSTLFKPGYTDWGKTAANILAAKGLPQRVPTGPLLPQIPFVDADVAGRLTGWLSAHHRQSAMKLESTLTLEDLRRGPAVMVGAFDNGWALAMLSNLRYHFQVDPATAEVWVEDAQNPSRRDWGISIAKPFFFDSSVDYAIVTRILDKDTGKWILSVAGMGMHGTEAAGELVTDPNLSGLLPAVLRSGRKNIQIVLKTTVIEGHTSLPQIVTVYTW
jgi:hypothetical protein